MGYRIGIGNDGGKACDTVTRSQGFRLSIFLLKSQYTAKPILEEKIKEKELKKPRQFGMISLSTNK